MTSTTPLPLHGCGTFGIANFKLVPATFWPLGRQIVDLDQSPAPRPA